MDNEFNELTEAEVQIIRNSFITELKGLCEKYNVTIETDDHWQGYAECGQDVRMEVCFPSWQIEDIDLGSWVDGKSYSTDKKD